MAWNPNYEAQAGGAFQPPGANYEEGGSRSIGTIYQSPQNYGGGGRGPSAGAGAQYGGPGAFGGYAPAAYGPGYGGGGYGGGGAQSQRVAPAAAYGYQQPSPANSGGGGGGSGNANVDSEGLYNPHRPPPQKWSSNAAPSAEVVSTGMRKQQVLKLEDTNMALFGTDFEKKVHHDASEKEPQWQKAGKQPGLEIWRIEQFKIVPWPRQQYGRFYDGDSYIVLYTYDMGQGKLGYNVHFWLGTYTSQDEAGTAAYKTVELDDYFDTLPREFREVQGSESPQFLSYFNNSVTVLNGGAPSGFKHWTAPDYPAHLYEINGPNFKDVRVMEVPFGHTSLTTDAIYILDKGTKIYEWLGRGANAFERSKGMELVEKLRNERDNSEVKIMEQGDADENSLFTLLGAPAAEPGARDLAWYPRQRMTARAVSSVDVNAHATKRLLIVSDESGKLTMKEIASHNFSRDYLKGEDVFIVDSGPQLWAWVGRGASVNERRSALHYAHVYLKEYKRPIELPLTRIGQGLEPNEFWQVFAG